MTRCNAASPAYKWCVSILVENTPLNLCHIFALQLQKVPCCSSPYYHSVCLLIIGSHADAEQLRNLLGAVELQQNHLCWYTWINIFISVILK